MATDSAIFVGNVPAGVDQILMAALLRAYSVERLTFRPFDATKNRYGYAIIQLSDVAEARRVIGDLHGMPILNSRLKVDFKTLKSIERTTATNSNGVGQQQFGGEDDGYSSARAPNASDGQNGNGHMPFNEEYVRNLEQQLSRMHGQLEQLRVGNGVSYSDVGEDSPVVSDSCKVANTENGNGYWNGGSGRGGRSHFASNGGGAARGARRFRGGGLQRGGQHQF